MLTILDGGYYVGYPALLCPIHKCTFTIINTFHFSKPWYSLGLTTQRTSCPYPPPSSTLHPPPPPSQPSGPSFTRSATAVAALLPAAHPTEEIAASTNAGPASAAPPSASIMATSAPTASTGSAQPEFAASPAASPPPSPHQPESQPEFGAASPPPPPPPAGPSQPVLAAPALTPLPAAPAKTTALMDILYAEPVLREAVCRPNRVIKLNRSSNYEAVIAQRVGQINSVKCKHCQKGSGPFVDCVSFDHLGPSCANCHYNNEASRCSFRGTASAASVAAAISAAFAADPFASGSGSASAGPSSAPAATAGPSSAPAARPSATYSARRIRPIHLGPVGSGLRPDINISDKYAKATASRGRSTGDTNFLFFLRCRKTLRSLRKNQSLLYQPPAAAEIDRIPDIEIVEWFARAEKITIWFKID
ncbi:hypothetical protein B7494_g1100 [Chlorociboria aeruginascens]|nr:hypothetical protein B7494_g1100 [Chlorociboria aeruginascens]